MAVETEVDSLVLDIKVNDNSNGETSAKKISTLDKVLTKFQKTIQNLDAKSFKTKFSALTTAIKPFAKELKNIKGELTALDRILKKTSLANVKNAVSGDTKIGEVNTPTNDSSGGTMPGAQDGKAQTLDNNSPDGDVDTLETLIQKYGEVSKKIDDADKKRTYFFQRFDGSNKITTKYTVDLKKQDDALEEVAGSFQYVGQTSSEVASGGLKSFFVSIKRIALYRLIRTSLKLVTDAMKDGIDNIIQFDASAKETMSEVTSSMTIMKNSVGSVMMPLLEIVAPIIQGISKAVAGLANGISYLTAKLKGESTWLKVNTDYMKEYNRASKLLSYDEFSTMSNSENDTNGMFEKVDMGEMSSGLLSNIQQVEVVLGSILSILGAIAVSKIAKWIADGGPGKLIGSFKDMKTKINDISKAGLVAGAAFSFVTSLVNLITVIKDWDSASLCTKITAITSVLLALAAVVFSILACIPAVGHVAVMKGLAVGLGAAAALTATVSAMRFADGGMIEQSLKGTGTMYAIAGEAGAEIVATGTRGTGVTNISQFKQAMVEALIEYNAARNGSDEGGDIVLVVDGKEFARAQVTNNANALRKNYNIELKPR